MTDRMADADSRYEVIFTIDFAAFSEPRRGSRWSWVKLSPQNVVTVRSAAFPTMRAAIDAAIAYRQRHGGGEIRVNIAESHHTYAADVIQLT